jgi:streptomycin 3"-adenylyltransferase
VNQLQEIAGLAGGVLGRDLIGAYLHGSSVLGGLRPASDLDVLLISQRSMDERERRALLGGLLGISGSRNKARPVELTVVVQPEVQPWRYPPTCDFLYGEWLRAEYEAGKIPRPEPMPDLALLITMALTGDSPPSPARGRHGSSRPYAGGEAGPVGPVGTRHLPVRSALPHPRRSRYRRR